MLTKEEVEEISVNLKHSIIVWLDTALPESGCTMGEVYMILGYAFFLAMKDCTLVTNIASRRDKTILAEINRSCTPEQARTIRKVFEEQGWEEGTDFIDHTKGGIDCYSKEEMERFKRRLKGGKMNLRQAIVFAIIMGADPRDLVPDYVLEKLESCKAYVVPEVILDDNNRVKFQFYAERWGMDWDTERDLSRPISELLKRRDYG